MSTQTQQAAFAAGCFWGVEEAFTHAPGVIETRVGYMGGHTLNPTYAEVCTDKTGHAEAVHVVFDPSKISYAQLLEIFWHSHNPTLLNRQGPDVGSQYRSAIFYYNDEEKQLALESKRALTESNKYDKPIVTEIIPATQFYSAEEYHQKYLQKKGVTSCHVNFD